MPPVSSTMTLKRIHREIADLKKEDMGGMSLAPSGDSLFSWTASIPGPEGSPYEDGDFKLSVDLAPDYPFSAPKVTFLTRIYHMNISDRGSVCLDVLKHNWSPALSLYKVLLSLSSLLTDPNPKDPLVPSIASTYTRNRKQHDNTAREWTHLYALTPKPQSQPPKLVVPGASVNNIIAMTKGKAKATPALAPTQATAPTIHASSSAGAPQRPIPGQVRVRADTGPNAEGEPDTVITIDSDSDSNSDSESARGVRGVRNGKRPSSAGSKRKRRVEGDDAGSGRGRKRQGIDSSGSGNGVVVDGRVIGDVIVIED